MDQFLSDLTNSLMGYYSELVAMLPRIAAGLIVLIFILWFSSYLKRVSRHVLNRRLDDALLSNFLSQVVKIVSLTIGILIVLKIIGLGGVAAGILATAGVSAFIIGFAMKDIGENFLASIIMAFDRPFKVGDIIEYQGMTGTITRMSLRETMIKTFDGKDIFIPNGQILKNPLTNYTIDGYLRYDFDIGLDYGSDVSGAIEIVLETLRGIDGILQEERKPFVAISSLGSSTLNLRVHYWIDTFNPRTFTLEVKTKAVDRSIQALNQAGYYLPCDIVELKRYKSENAT